MQEATIIFAKPRSHYYPLAASSMIKLSIAKNMSTFQIILLGGHIALLCNVISQRTLIICIFTGKPGFKFESFLTQYLFLLFFPLSLTLILIYLIENTLGKHIWEFPPFSTFL
ncbi:hypothetical protein ACJX0J_027245, partial [Zea mays]